MATKTKPAKDEPAVKPAAKPAKPAKKPANAQGDGETRIGLKDVAERLGRDPRSVRASIRRILGGPQVGKGGRYTWKSFNDPSLKKLMRDLQTADTE